MKLYHWILALCATIILLASCEDGDFFDENGFFILPELSFQITLHQPIYLSLIDKDSLTSQVSIEIIELPEYGDLQLLNNGYALYIPHIDFLMGEDRVTYSITYENGEWYERTATILMLTPSDSLCFNHGIQTDIYTTHTLDNQEIAFDIFDNDSLCDGSSYANSSIQLLTNAIYGEAQITDERIIYRISDERFNDTTQAFSETIPYEVTIINNGVEMPVWSSAVFQYIPYEDTLSLCEPMLLTDQFSYSYANDQPLTVEQTTMVLDSLIEILELEPEWPVFELSILENDILCDGDQLLKAMFDSQNPVENAYIFTIDHQVFFIPKGVDITGSFSIIYQVETSEQLTFSEEVFLSITP